ncbi:MAG: hypothetical protein AAB824_00480 [Patescibacteria group bacterium]
MAERSTPATNKKFVLLKSIIEDIKANPRKFQLRNARLIKEDDIFPQYSIDGKIMVGKSPDGSFFICFSAKSEIPPSKFFKECTSDATYNHRSKYSYEDCLVEVI